MQELKIDIMDMSVTDLLWTILFVCGFGFFLLYTALMKAARSFDAVFETHREEIAEQIESSLHTALTTASWKYESGDDL